MVVLRLISGAYSLLLLDSAMLHSIVAAPLLRRRRYCSFAPPSPLLLLCSAVAAAAPFLRCRLCFSLTPSLLVFDSIAANVFNLHKISDLSFLHEHVLIDLFWSFRSDCSWSSYKHHGYDKEGSSGLSFNPLCCTQNASGAVKHEDIVEKVNKIFTILSTNPITSNQLVENEPAIFTGLRWCYLFSGASWTDPDSIALLVIRFMLGSWNKATELDKYKRDLKLEEMKEFEKEREKLMKKYEEKIAEMKSKYWKEQLEIKEGFNGELNQLMTSYISK